MGGKTSAVFRMLYKCVGFRKNERPTMEGRRQVDSSSSLTSQLFGTKESPPSNSSEFFASIFPPPPKAVGRSHSSSEVRGLTGNQMWDTKKGFQDMGKSGERAGCIIPNKDKNQILLERVEPCHLSSSLYYGGQDIFSNCSSTHTSGSYPVFKKDEDDPNGNNSHGASRGNWWQGSLYY